MSSSGVPELMGAGEIARLLGVSRQAIRNWETRGHVRRVVWASALQPHYDVQELLACEAARRAAGTVRHNVLGTAVPRNLTALDRHSGRLHPRSLDPADVHAAVAEQQRNRPLPTRPGLVLPPPGTPVPELRPVRALPTQRPTTTAAPVPARVLPPRRPAPPVA